MHGLKCLSARVLLMGEGVSFKLCSLHCMILKCMITARRRVVATRQKRSPCLPNRKKIGGGISSGWTLRWVTCSDQCWDKLLVLVLF